MRNIAAFIVVSLISGTAIAVGCGNSSSTNGTGGAAAATASHASSGKSVTATATSTGTTGTTGVTTGTTGAGGMGTGGAPSNPFECMLPAAPPSKGACVAFMADAGSGELDAGVDDGGNASATTCNPITNAGCTGTDVCGPDAANKFYFCQSAGMPAGLPACGDCSAQAATCGVGALCVGLSMTSFVCAQMCCTAADCGSGKCDTKQLTMALPSGVGLCIP